jgi:hypothetical protein
MRTKRFAAALMTGLGSFVCLIAGLYVAVTHSSGVHVRQPPPVRTPRGFRVSGMVAVEVNSIAVLAIIVGVVLAVGSFLLGRTNNRKGKTA